MPQPLTAALSHSADSEKVRRDNEDLNTKVSELNRTIETQGGGGGLGGSRGDDMAMTWR